MDLSGSASPRISLCFRNNFKGQAQQDNMFQIKERFRGRITALIMLLILQDITVSIGCLFACRRHSIYLNAQQVRKYVYVSLVKNELESVM